MGFHPPYMLWTAPTNPAPAAAPSAPQAIPPTAPQGTFGHLTQASLPIDHLLTLTLTAATQPPATQTNQQFGRFGQPASQEPASYPTTKPFEPFGQQQPATSGPQSQFDAGFQGQGQAAQVQSQQQPGGPFSSAPSDYSSYYTADQQNRYNNYYNQNFAQQQSAQGQESLSSQPQRSFSGYNAAQTDNLSQYPQSGSQHGQSRFGSTTGTDAQITATPAPGATTAQAQTGPAAQAQSHGQQQPHDYPYSSHPYYTNPYYSAYMNYQGGYNQAGYGGGPYGKAGYQQQPSQYGVSPQGPHGYSSPAAAFGQSTLHRDSGAAAGLGDYGRAGSAQSGQAGLGGFGGAHDTFGRGASAYQSQAGQSFAPGSQPGGVPSAADDLKPFGEAKATGGPSPSMGAAARPGSAANNGPSQSGLPPPQSAQQSGLGMGGYGGYPSHMQQQQQGHGLHGSQSGAGAGYGMSATGAQGGHQNNYGGGGYGGQGFTGSYYGNPPQRGWGNNYH